MRFRPVLALMVLAFLGSPASRAESPNIVLISLDTFRADRLAPWGGPKDLAPALNALAAKGSVYTGCFAPAPITLPSHATLLTGAFPFRRCAISCRWPRREWSSPVPGTVHS